MCQFLTKILCCISVEVKYEDLVTAQEYRSWHWALLLHEDCQLWSKTGGWNCNWWNISGDVKKTRIKKVLWTVEWKAFVVHEDECCMILIWVKSPAFCLLNSLCSLDVPKCETVVEETWMKHRNRNKQHGLKSTNHKPWPFELVEVNMCFLGGLLRWLTEQKKSLQTRSAI